MVFALLTLAAAHLLAVISPGPSLLVVTRTAMAVSRQAGLWTALGFAIGSLIWAAAALFGLNLLFVAAPWLYTAMRVGGALYLLYLAVMLWRHARAPFDLAPAGRKLSESGRASFRRGLLTQMSNPKVVVFMGSILVALLPPDPPTAVLAAVLLIVFLNEFAWYAFVACAFSLPRLRRGYGRVKGVIDRTAGVFLAGLGLRLLAD